MEPLTTSDSEREAAVLIRSLLLNSGRKCRLCTVIVQAAGGGGVQQGMKMHMQIVHGIGQRNGN